MLQLGLIVFLNKHTEPRSTEPLQVAPPKRLTSPGPSPLKPQESTYQARDVWLSKLMALDIT